MLKPTHHSNIFAAFDQLTSDLRRCIKNIACHTSKLDKIEPATQCLVPLFPLLGNAKRRGLFQRCCRYLSERTGAFQSCCKTCCIYVQRTLDMRNSRFCAGTSQGYTGYLLRVAEKSIFVCNIHCQVRKSPDTGQFAIKLMASILTSTCCLNVRRCP